MTVYTNLEDFFSTLNLQAPQKWATYPNPTLLDPLSGPNLTKPNCWDVIEKMSHVVTLVMIINLSIYISIYLQVMNLCLQHRVRFAHPPLQHEFRACQGQSPRTPGCIPILVLAALDPNH